MSEPLRIFARATRCENNAFLCNFPHQSQAKDSPPPPEPCSINTLKFTNLNRQDTTLHFLDARNMLEVNIDDGKSVFSKFGYMKVGNSKCLTLLCSFVYILYDRGFLCVSPLPRCSNGYFGQPSVPGSSCQPCDCHGNLDLSLPGSCDPITGQCLRCRQGYGGASCGSCVEGYYGDAVTAKNCQRE